MIEYYLNTGVLHDSEDYYNFGQVSNGISSINNNNVLQNLITINGQTLLETEPIVTIVGQKEIIVNSGDYFLSGNYLRETTGFLDLNFDARVLKYDVVGSGFRYFYRSDVNSNLITGFSGVLDGNLGGDLVFLNGIKLVSGESYIEDANGNFEWIDADTDITGVLFSSPRKNHVYYSGSFDLVDVYYNKRTSIGYLNGVKLDNGDFLETSSLNLHLIETGLEPTIEFPIEQETETVTF